jgi:hypothetical protein
MIGEYLPKEEKEYLRSILDKRREKRKETADRSVNDSDLLFKNQSEEKFQTPSKPGADVK